MGIVIDVILVAIFLLNIILGYKKGLVGAVFSICAFLIALIISLILYTPITNLVIENTELDDKIAEAIINNNLTNFEEETQNEEESSFFQRYLYEKVEEVAIEAKDEALTIVAEYISIEAVKIIVGIALFIVVRIAVILLKFVIEGLATLPMIRQLNEVGGIAYGVLKAFVIIYIILAILLLVVSINGNGLISETIENSYIAKFICENIILKTIAI